MAKQPSPIVSSITNATFGLWFPFFRFMCRTLPPVWVARLAEATAERAIWERESVREAILDNFAHVLNAPRAARDVEEAGRAMVSRHSRFWIDLLRFAGRPPEETAGLLSERVGDEELLKAHVRGRGAILLTAHVGNFELGGIFLRQIGLQAFGYSKDRRRGIGQDGEADRRQHGRVQRLERHRDTLS